MNIESARSLLGVTADADEKTIRRAYAKLAKVHRPDSDPEGFSNIRSAYDCLLEAVRNDAYEDVEMPDFYSQSSDDALNPTPNFRIASESVDDRPLNNEVDTTPIDEAVESVSAEEPASDEYVNPLQSMEDELLAAMQAVRPGEVDSENAVVIAADNYLSSSEEISRQLRQRVEHGLIHACLSGQYIPHVLRQRVANFTGLADSMVADGRLQAWERDFIERLEHSEVLEELIQKSGYRTERVERALIKGVRWDQALMLRFDDTASNSIDRWMYWLDHTTGTDSGFVHPTLRERWQRLQIVQPLHWSTLVVFACVMGLFGYALDLIGVPLSSFFDSSTANKVITVVLLAVLSLANFTLVICSLPMLEKITSKTREVLLTQFAGPVLLFEVVASLVLIWSWTMGDYLPSGVAPHLVLVSGMSIALVAILVREWSWLRDIPFGYGMLRLFLLAMLGILVAPLLAGGENLGSPFWIALLVVVAGIPPRVLNAWEDYDGEVYMLVASRLGEPATSIWKWLLVLLLFAFTGAFLIVFSRLLPEMAVACTTAVLATGIWLEMCLLGGIYTHSQLRGSLYGTLTAAGMIAVRRFPEAAETIMQVGMILLLLIIAKTELRKALAQS